MAFFKFRKRGDAAASASTTAQASPAQSVEAMRKRARQRLIGAAVLVLVGVVGFPLVFDTQPRPIAVDIPIDIPDRAKARPLAPAGTAAGTVAADATPSAAVKADPAAVAAASAPAPSPGPAPAPAAVAVPAPAAVVAAAGLPAKPASALAAAPASAASAASATASAKPAASAPKSDADRAKALLEGKDPNAAAGEGRFVVQVGAFADPAKAASARQKLEKAGLKTYTHVAETKDGKRIRVRVGPFSSKAEADKAATKVKGLDLQASVLTL